MTALAGQVALVTGASRGIGAAVAAALAAAGAHVILMARDAKALEAIEERIFAAGGSATIAPLDLAEPDAIARLAAAVGERWGRLDMLIHAAALLPQLTPVGDIDLPAFNKALTVNVLATQALIARFGPLLKQSADPRLIYFTTSVASEPRAFWGAYAATKAAAENLVESYAHEVKNTDRVRVAIVYPGATRTQMRARAYPGEDPASVKPPEAVAERVLSLLGEQFASPHRLRINQPA